MIGAENAFRLMSLKMRNTRPGRRLSELFEEPRRQDQKKSGDSNPTAASFI